MTISRPRTIPPRRRPPSPRLGRVGTQGGRAAFLALGPTDWYDARDLINTTHQTIANRVGAGVATLGSSSGDAVNDPTIVPFDAGSAPFARIPNVAGNILTLTGITAPVDGQTYVETVTRIRPWSIAADITYATTASTHLGVYLRSTGKLLTYHLNPGAVAVGNAQSPSAIPGFAAGTWYWLKMRVTQASALCEYWYSTDTTTDPAQVTWTSLGSASGTNAGTGFNTGQQTVFTVGSWSVGLAPGGPFDIQYFSINWSGQAWKSWTCDTGQTTNNTLTVTRSTTGLSTSIVTRPTLTFDGSDDYLQLPTAPTFTATTGAYTAVVAVRIRAMAASGAIWSSESASNVGASLFVTAAGVITARVGGATTTADATVSTAQDDDVTLNVVALVYSAGTVRAYRYGSTISATTDTTGVGTVTHATPRIASRGDSVALPLRAEVMAHTAYSTALTQTQLDTVAAYLLGTYG